MLSDHLAAAVADCLSAQGLPDAEVEATKAACAALPARLQRDMLDHYLAWAQAWRWARGEAACPEWLKVGGTP